MPTVKEINPSTSKEPEDVDVDHVDETKKTIEKIFRDISKTSATKQILMGASTGWLSGYLAMKVGKVVAFGVGGGIILLEFANEMGYIKINWSKINRGIDKVGNRVEETLTGRARAPGWIDKMEHYVDKNVDKAEELVKNGKHKAKRWYSAANGNSDYTVKDVHIFTLAFIAGVALGVATS